MVSHYTSRTKYSNPYLLYSMPLSLHPSLHSFHYVCRGLRDDPLSEDPAMFTCSSNNRHSIPAPRKLRVGDVVTVVCDLSVGTVTIVVNTNEFAHTFGGGSPIWLLSMKCSQVSVCDANVYGPSERDTGYVVGATLGERI